MKPIHAFVSLLLGTALLPAAPAQTLLALEATAAGGARVHEVFANCTTVTTCALPPGALPSAITPPLGGLGWTGTHVVATDGGWLVTVDLRCNVVQSCQIFGFGPVHDMAVDGATNTLHFTDGGSLGSVALGCPMGGIAPSRRATVPAPLQMPVTALDVDPTTGSLWVCDAAGTVAEVVFPSPWSAAVQRSFPITQYPGMLPVALPIGGLAFDRCAQRVYLADAQGLLIHLDLQGNPRGQCRVPLSPGGFVVGLARRPRQPTPLGGACAGSGLPSCRARIFTNGGDATVPNPSFRIETNGAPWPSGPAPSAFLLLDILPGPTPLPGVCAPLQVGLSGAMAALFCGPVLNDVNGMAPCHGMASRPLPVPNAPQLCGGTLYAQWVFLGGAGLALSDGLRITID